MNKLTKRRLKYLWVKTTGCFEEAKRGASPAVEVDQKYRDNLCKLSSSVLEDIIIAAENGQTRRANVTIDAIKNELISRAIFDTKK